MTDKKFEKATFRAKNGSIYITVFEEDDGSYSDWSAVGEVEIPPGKYFVNVYPAKKDDDGNVRLTANGKRMASIQFKPFEPRGDGGYRGRGEGRSVNRVPHGPSDKYEKINNEPAAYEPDIDDEIPF